MSCTSKHRYTEYGNGEPQLRYSSTNTEYITQLKQNGKTAKSTEMPHAPGLKVVNHLTQCLTLDPRNKSQLENVHGLNIGNMERESCLQAALHTYR